MGRYSRFILAAILIVSFGAYADAQNMSYRFSGYGYRQSPEVNRYLSARYDHLLQVSPGFRRYRMWKECHTINFPELRGECLGSFDQFEPVLPGY
jgi:hypothetical protein